jgi:HAD superfamily hydrolase (TIGR01509 family)
MPADVEASVEGLTLKLIADNIQPMDGALEVVYALAHEGCQLAVASNSTRPVVESMLAKVNLRWFFDGHIATKEQVCNPKPAPDVYQLAADLLGKRCDLCIAVEDSPTGVTSAREAGMKVVAFCPPYGTYSKDELLNAGASWLLHDLRALLDEPVCSHI